MQRNVEPPGGRPTVDGGIQPKAIGSLDPVAKVSSEIANALADGLKKKSPDDVARILAVWSQPNFRKWLGGDPELLLIRYLVGEHWEKFEHKLIGSLNAVGGTLANIIYLTDINSSTRPIDQRLKDIEERASKGKEYLQDTLTIVASLNIAMRASKTSQAEDVDFNSLIETPLRASFHSAMGLGTLEEGHINVKQELDISNPKVRADPILLQSVFLNVLMNSMYSMENTDVKELHIKTSKTQEAEKTMVELRVKDSGEGFNPTEKVNDKGEPDPSGKQTMKQWIMGLFNTTKEERGTGLGLYLSKSIVEMFGGTFDINSEGKGKGVEVTIRLPAL